MDESSCQSREGVLCTTKISLDDAATATYSWPNVPVKTVISLGGVEKAKHEEKNISTLLGLDVPTLDAGKKFDNENFVPIPSDTAHNVLQTPLHFNASSDRTLAVIPTPLLDDSDLYIPQKKNVGTQFWNSVNFARREMGVKKYIWVAASLLIVVGVSIGLLWGQNNQQKAMSAGKVSDSFNQQDYEKWSRVHFGKLVPQDSDEDSDELKNKEEFLVGSDPTKFSSCNNTISDAETLYQLIDPKSCQKITISDDEVINRISKVMNLKRFNQQLATSMSASSSSSSLSSLISTIVDSQILSRDQLDSAQRKLEEQKKYAQLLDKIDAYIEQFRSYGTFDRDYETPVSGITYLQISLKYNVPIKYMIAIARLESRFGTDQYTDSGALTRPGQYKNIYSLGLDDSGNNLNFVSWADGIEAFGRWYKNMEEKGVSDCAKWRIYNPNGDYCSKVESSARNFEEYEPLKK